MKLVSRTTIVAVAVASLLIGRAAAAAKPGLPVSQVLPPQAQLFGLSLGEWSARWWTWAYSYPWDANPIADTTGQFCALGDVGQVWFLGGYFGAGTVERICTVSQKPLFFPILNNVWVTTPFDPQLTTAAQIRPIVKPPTDAVTNLELWLNGEKVLDTEELIAYRAESPVFQTSLALFCPVSDPSCLPGPYPAMSDGYYVLLPPLAPGHYTLRIRAHQDSVTIPEEVLTSLGFPPGYWNGFWPEVTQDVTYHLTVTN